MEGWLIMSHIQRDKILCLQCTDLSLIGVQILFKLTQYWASNGFVCHVCHPWE